MTLLPAKITPDAIREALLEIRFEHGDLPEVALGQLGGHADWSPLPKSRLPGAEIPDQLRSLDPNLRYIPSVEVRLSETEVVRVGYNALSHHNVGSYLGWNSFQPRLAKTAAVLFNAVPTAKITRLGLRYINVLLREDHHIASLYDLDVRVEVAGRPPSSRLQLVYEIDIAPDLRGLVRVITPNFVADASVSPAAVAVIDIDIYTPTAPGNRSVEEVTAWLERAHDAEKNAFFSLLKDETVNRLQEA
jgi:uncharacterized protein (TIGR04255 family)